jgi:hypothetical protein
MMGVGIMGIGALLAVAYSNKAPTSVKLFIRRVHGVDFFDSQRRVIIDRDERKTV